MHRERSCIETFAKHCTEFLELVSDAFKDSWPKLSRFSNDFSLPSAIVYTRRPTSRWLMSPRSLLPITNADLTEEARGPENERRLHKSKGDFPLNLPCVMRQSVNLLICHRRQKIFVYTVLSAVTFATIIVFLYCLPKSLNPFEPFSLLFARVPRSSKLVNEHDKQKRYRDYDNSIVFDHVSTIR